MIAIIDYGMGNLRSVHNAFKFIAPQIESVVTSDPAIISKADRIVFPGQGAMPDCIRELEKRGLREIVKDSATSKPFLGICIGLQMLFDESEEGDVQGLGIFRGNVKRFKSFNNIKIPHMGWNAVHLEQDSPLFKGISKDDFVYYVHSFYCETGEETMASTDYTLRYSASLQKDNFYALQFHPEKSGKTGQQILKNFLEL